MRSFATVAVFAGAAAASYTQYSTKEVTITSCGPDVYDCPGEHQSSTVYPEHQSSTTCTDSEMTYATPTTYYPPTETHPVYSQKTSETHTMPVDTHTMPVYSQTSGTETHPVYSQTSGTATMPVGSSSMVYSQSSGTATMPVQSSSMVYSSVYSQYPSSSMTHPVYPSNGVCPPAVTTTVTVTMPGNGNPGYPTGSATGGMPSGSVPAGYPSSAIETHPVYPSSSGSVYMPGMPSSTGGYSPQPPPTNAPPPYNAAGKAQAGIFAAAVGAIAAFFL